jgi:hypothetical protein
LQKKFAICRSFEKNYREPFQAPDSTSAGPSFLSPSSPTAHTISNIDIAQANGVRTWNLLNTYRGCQEVQILLQFAYVLEEHIENITHLHHLSSISKSHTATDFTSPAHHTEEILKFYSQPSLHLSRKHLSKNHLAQQLSLKPSVHCQKATNKFALLHSDDPSPDIPSRDFMVLSPSSHSTSASPMSSPAPPKKVSWTSDTGIAKLSSIFQNLVTPQANLPTESESISPPKNIMLGPDVIVNQRLWLNLIRHRNADASTPTLQQFRSFATTMRESDQLLSFLPVNSTKQDLPSPSN